MLARPAANKDTFTVTTPSDTEVRMTRLFNAPPALLWEAMTKPEHIKKWWGNLGDGYSVPVCEVDLRVGGKWRFVNKHPQGEAAFNGVYREIDAPSHIVFTEIYEPFPDAESVVSSEYTDEGGKTRMVATIRYPSKDIRDMVMSTGMADGAGMSYDRLDDLATELASR
jgi:uncharacterized protein YndB with AHSA1/START domain